MHDPYTRRHYNPVFQFNLYLIPAWALPRPLEAPQGKVVERCMIHAPLADDEPLAFGRAAK
jgi:hypothetical protein